ncbi:MAG TPA: phosphate ABC transporter ATP-binding protein PstB [Thermoplasmata archaeon]|nr:phosphate ABC transporter ATP-binding protein PstB [Thermoplasmata archaeon]
MPAAPSLTTISDIAIESRGLSVYYGAKAAIRNVSLQIGRRQTTAIIGPSGCGKSTYLRAINRMNDTIKGCRTEGQMLVDQEDAYAPNVDPVLLRRKVGLIFQKPNPFPKSIYENAAFGVRIHYRATEAELDQIVESALRQADLWDEVSDRLDENALSLSGGQQQRLCIARALAIEPDFLLMDEPCSALDPIATARIEDLMFELKKDMTIVIVTHNMQQAARVADHTAFLYLGRLVEYSRTRDLFERPHEELTENYITGRFG